MNRLARWLLLLTGVLLILSGVAHAFLGWPALSAELSEARVGADLARTVAIGWLYGSGAMVCFGAIVILVWRAERRDAGPASRFAVPIALLYLIFGASAFAYTSGNPHFLLFIAPGALLALGWWGTRRAT